MKKIFIPVSLATILFFLPALSFCSSQQPSTMQFITGHVMNAYNAAAPVVSDAFTISGEFVQTKIVPFFTNPQPSAKKSNHSLTGAIDSLTGNQFEEFEEVAPKVNFQRFTAMMQSGALKKCLKEDPATAIGYLNTVTSDNFKEKESASACVQEKIFQTFSIASKLSEEESTQIELAKALACAYREVQSRVVTALILEDANKAEPILKSNREKSIEQANQKREQTIAQATTLCQQETSRAHDLYSNELKKRREFKAKAAFSLHYLQLISGEREAINLDDFSSNEKYLALLTSKQTKLSDSKA